MATGGGPSTAPPLGQWVLKVLEIMGDGFGERQTGARVPAFDEVNKSQLLYLCSVQITSNIYRNNFFDKGR